MRLREGTLFIILPVVPEGAACMSAREGSVNVGAAGHWGWMYWGRGMPQEFTGLVAWPGALAAVTGRRDVLWGAPARGVAACAAAAVPEDTLVAVRTGMVLERP